MPDATNRKKRVIIMGAAGRDFHNFNVCFRDNPTFQVVAFTATQIPNISGRIYPAQLAGRFYPKGIPIYPEIKLVDLIKKENIDQVVFSYSDVSYEYLMHRAALITAAGADFVLLSPNSTMLKSKRPVIAVCAVRTGCGKSPVTRRIGDILKKVGKKFVVIRHPMPYGDLNKQRIQKFVNYSDLDKHECTIEEREEYEPHLDRGFTVFAGVDYQAILRQAELESEIILWDGGNNDCPFIKPDLMVTVTDPHRAGHELSYWPGEVNFRLADVIIINKVDTAKKESIEKIKQNIKNFVPKAKVILAACPISVTDADLIRNKKALVIEDGPTVTHGGATFGAGFLAAKKYKAKIVDPTPYLAGSLKEVFKKYSHLKNILPAMGYGSKQVKELEKTINSSPAEVVISGTPIDLTRILKTKKPIIRVRYELEEKLGNLEKIIKDFLKKFLGAIV